MPPPNNADELLELIKKSGVNDENKVSAALKRIGAEGELPFKPDELAGKLVRESILTYFQAEQLLAGKWKRFFIGRYKVLERIGSGGMGQVYLCEHTQLRRRVAVKVLPTAKSTDDASRDRFYREARAVAALDHPNLVRAYDVDQDDNLHYLVMEYVDGSSLLEIVRKTGPMSHVRAAHYIYGAAVGLHHASEIGLVHRDIKPANILVDRSGIVKVLDMGLARFFHDEEEGEEAGITRRNDENILGTADYLSPEQTMDSHNVDVRADIYSLGGTFYFLLSGHPPFPEGSIPQKLLWHQTRDPAPILTIRPDIPVEIADILARMMLKDRNQRFQSPAEVMAALAPYVRTPIPPPTEAELPKLSPAAAVAGLGPQGPKVNAAAMLVNQQLTYDPTRSSGSTPSYSLSDASSPGHSTAEFPMPAVLSAAAPAPVVQESAPAPEIFIDPNAPLSEEGSTRARLRREAEKKKTSRMMVFVGAGAVLVLGMMIALVIWGVLGPKPTPTDDTAKGVKPGARSWYVSSRKEDKREGRVESLAKAIQLASPGDRIVLVDERLDETMPIRIDSVKRGLVIESENRSKPTRIAVRSERSETAFDLRDVTDVKISGIILELDGRCGRGIRVKGGGAGLRLQDITISNPRDVGIELMDVHGGELEAQVVNCRVHAETAPKTGAIVCSRTREIQIFGCRLEGAGCENAIKIIDSAENVKLRNNRIYNFEYGLFLAGTGEVKSTDTYSVIVTDNTFVSLSKAGVACQHPLTGKAQSLVIERNYFGFAEKLLLAPYVTGNKLPGLVARENVRDSVGVEGNIPLNAKGVTLENELLLPPPADDDKFLRVAPTAKYGARADVTLP